MISVDCWKLVDSSRTDLVMSHTFNEVCGFKRLVISGCSTRPSSWPFMKKSYRLEVVRILLSAFIFKSISADMDL